MPTEPGEVIESAAPAAGIDADCVVRLAHGFRLRDDPARGGTVLLGPETVLVLNPTGTEILRLCDGRTVGAVVAELCGRYGTVPAEQVHVFLTRLARRRGVTVERRVDAEPGGVDHG